MKTLFAVAGVSTLIGCSSVGVHSQARGASEEAARDAEVTALRIENEEQEQELRTVRGQLALARAEVQELKAEKDFAPRLSRKTSGGDELPWAKDRAAGLDMEPVLRLDGEVVDERLPITAGVPDLPAFAEPEPAQAPQVPVVSVEGYRRGLSLIREQKFEEALLELDANPLAQASGSGWYKDLYSSSAGSKREADAGSGSDSAGSDSNKKPDKKPDKKSDSKKSGPDKSGSSAKGYPSWST